MAAMSDAQPSKLNLWVDFLATNKVDETSAPLLATRCYINGGDPWCFRLSIVLRQQGPPPGRLTEWTLLVQNLLRPTLAILSTEVSMPISDDDARAKRIRDIAEVLVRGIDRLFNSRDSASQSPPDALSFRDKPCSVSSTLVRGLRDPESRRDTWN